MFLGSQPNDLAAARLEGAVGPEEDKARALVMSLDAKQRAMTVFDRTEKRDADMLSGINTRRVMPLGSPGLQARQMNADQKTLLVALVEEYLTRVPADEAAERRGQLLNARPSTRFPSSGLAAPDPGRRTPISCRDRHS